MPGKIVASPAHAEKMVREAYENFPEASISLACNKWRYGTKPGETFEFWFTDVEGGGQHYVVKLPDAVRGFHRFVDLVTDGKLPGLSLGPGWLTDTGEWDGECFDALLQCAIFGDVIYG